LACHKGKISAAGILTNAASVPTFSGIALDGKSRAFPHLVSTLLFLFRVLSFVPTLFSSPSWGSELGQIENRDFGNFFGCTGWAAKMLGA